jgi:hypothetical protein
LQLFKKQWLRLNPTSMDCNVFTNIKSFGNHDQALPDADNNASFVFKEDDQSIVVIHHLMALQKCLQLRMIMHVSPPARNVLHH